MRVLIAPDSFGTSLTALEAATAISTGWAEVAPNDVLIRHPLADGGPGFLSVLHATLGGSLRSVSTVDPWGTQNPTAQLLTHEGTTYLESAHAVGLQLAAGRPLPAESATSIGLGELLVAALQENPRRVCVGLGGSAVIDGGVGAGNALLSWPTNVELVICADVLVPLLGPTGAIYGFAEQKGAARSELARLETGMLARAELLESMSGRGVRDVPGAGAAGGLGAWLLSLGGRVVAGIDLVADATGLEAQIASVDVVVTGEGKTDPGSLRGKVVGGVAARAAAAGKPCLVAAGQIEVGRREAAAHGIDELFSCTELAGTPEAAIAEPKRWLEALSRQIARSWSDKR